MQETTYDILYNSEIDHWWYRVRRHIARTIIQKYLKNNQDKIKILDIGCGTGALLKEMEYLGESYGIDNAVQAIEFCKQRGLNNVKIGAIESIPYPDDSFDFILVMDVLEHIKDDNLALREVNRVLRSGGYAFITVPAFKFLWGWSDIAGQHYRRYTLGELKVKILNQDLEIVRASYFNVLLFFPILLVRAVKRILGRSEKPEVGDGSQVINTLLYYIFKLESIILRYISFPFGVSCMAICKKKGIYRSMVKDECN